MKCNDIQEYFIDYLEGDMGETKRKEIENHLIECESCKEEMKELQQIVTGIESESDLIQVPDGFMNKVSRKVSNTQESRRKVNKHRVTMGLVATLFLTIFVGTAVATNSFASVKDWWKDLSNKQNEEMQSYIDHGIGERLNLEAESNGVKVTITNVVADDIQTLIYYEIEDQKKENKYMINISDGLKIANQDQNWISEDDSSYSPVTNSLSLYSESDYIFKGRLGVSPMSIEEGTIQLKLSKLEKLKSTPVDTEGSQSSVPSGNDEFIEGDWRFDIPVKKYPSIVHDIKVETKIEGNPVIFDKVTIAPTITIVSYRYTNENSDKNMEYINFDSLESKRKRIYENQIFGGYNGSGGSEGGWKSAEATFESLYFEKPKNIRLHMGSATFSIKDQARFAIDASKELPQTFKYLGNEISIDQIGIGEPTKIVMTEELNPKRTYEMLDYHFYDKDGQGSSSDSVDGYYIDKDGKKYKGFENFYRLNDLEQPRFFSTEHHIELSRDDKKEHFVPVGIEIEGYTITSFSNQIIELPLK
ncbi:UNVERIFIED_ORG: hypothetical protein ABIC97_002616 [Peribacillus simplex]